MEEVNNEVKINGVCTIIKEAALSIIQVHGSHYLNPEMILRINTHIGLIHDNFKEEILNNPERPITDEEANYIYDCFVAFFNNGKQGMFGVLGKNFQNIKNTLIPALEFLRKNDNNHWFTAVIGRRIFEIIKYQWIKEQSESIKLATTSADNFQC